MIRVVLDTNIVISAMLRSGGLPEAIFNLGVNKAVQLCVSEPVLAEYHEVLHRPRLAINPEKAAKAKGIETSDLASATSSTKQSS
jgi:putative PIN family toxin of toxin-antitoxin system